MNKFECPKPKTGILCGDCNLRNSCLYLNPIKPKPKLYPRSERKIVFQPIPIKITKPTYKMALLISEDFTLTKAEFGDLIYYTSRFSSFAPKGGRGKSWERVFALTCIEILRRDRRPIYTNNELYYDTKYRFKKSNTKKLKRFIRQEFEKINKTIPALECEKMGSQLTVEDIAEATKNMQIVGFCESLQKELQEKGLIEPYKQKKRNQDQLKLLFEVMKKAVSSETIKILATYYSPEAIIMNPEFYENFGESS